MDTQFSLQFAWFLSSSFYVFALAASEPIRLATNLPEVQQEIVRIHNTLRRAKWSKSMLAMTWDPEAQKQAEAWAERCDMRHPSNDAERKQFLTTSQFHCGQNLGMGQHNWHDVIIDGWYSEIRNFEYGGKEKGAIGHFTAIVWGSTFKVGCGYKDCGKGRQFYVCNYCPAPYQVEMREFTAVVYPCKWRSPCGFRFYLESWVAIAEIPTTDNFWNATKSNCGNIGYYTNKPYETGPQCERCLDNCDNGLCTNPCEYIDDFDNCDYPSPNALLPDGCANTTYEAKLLDGCKATCKCKGKKLYFRPPPVAADANQFSSNNNCCLTITIAFSMSMLLHHTK